MKEQIICIRTMYIEDYKDVMTLWKKTNGFRLRNIDDDYIHIEKFLKRNIGLSCVATFGGKVIGTLLSGHDGRQATFYHVCVDEEFRRRNIGEQMATYAINVLKEEGICKISLVAFKTNIIGNAFWKKMGFRQNQELNNYEYILEMKNSISLVG